MKFDFYLIGPVAVDKIVVPGKEESVVTGGAVWYAAFVLRSLGHKVALATRMSRQHRTKVDKLINAGVKVFLRESFETSGILNVYSSPDMEERTCTVLGCAGPFLPEHLPEVEAKVFYLGALMRGEIPLETVRFAAKKAQKVVIDVQGFLRYRKGNNLLTDPFHAMEAVLANTWYCKCDRAEARVITGIDDLAKAAELISLMGPKEVLITSHQEVVVYADEQIHRDQFSAKNLAGRTGRGDTFTGTYTGMRELGYSPSQSLRVACFVTSRKMEKPGPYCAPIDPELILQSDGKM